LATFARFGVEETCGVDGEHVDPGLLEIPQERFVIFDLQKPFTMDRRFDLVVSLEVAEHLPSERAETFVGSLTGLGPVVLFSAAIPAQGGRGHVNEQWPEYWHDRFRQRDFVAIDCLRPRLWYRDDVEWWYAQNILIFVAREHLESMPTLRQMHARSGGLPLSVVHPRKYRELLEWCLSHEPRE
jgi:hypothetical protein